MIAAGPGMSVVVPACGRTEALAALPGCAGRAAAGSTVGWRWWSRWTGPTRPPPPCARSAPERLDLQVVQSAADRAGRCAQPRRRGGDEPAAARVRRRRLRAGGPDWAAALVAALERDPDALVGGPLLNAYPRDSVGRSFARDAEALYDVLHL